MHFWFPSTAHHALSGVPLNSVKSQQRQPHPAWMDPVQLRLPRPMSLGQGSLLGAPSQRSQASTPITASGRRRWSLGQPSMCLVWGHLQETPGRGGRPRDPSDGQRDICVAVKWRGRQGSAHFLLSPWTFDAEHTGSVSGGRRPGHLCPQRLLPRHRSASRPHDCEV